MDANPSRPLHATEEKAAFAEREPLHKFRPGARKAPGFGGVGWFAWLVEWLIQLYMFFMELRELGPDGEV